MRQACARAAQLGLAGLTFTDHADFTTLAVSDAAAAYIRQVGGQVTEGTYRPPPLDVTGYLDSIARCRDEYQGLQIQAGIELGDPHLHPHAAAALADSGNFDLIVGSLHSLRCPAGFADVADRYDDLADADVVREYLAEVSRMIETSGDFEVLAHINYAARYWRGRLGAYRSADFEDEYRAALRALAAGGRALEVNTSGWLPLDPALLDWWRQEGGAAITFGSDAHDPATAGHQFQDAAEMAGAAGFWPDRDGSAFWVAA
jgi:histidinol-phosphatase (PHP family)